MNILKCFLRSILRRVELPFKYAVKAVSSCVDFVPPMLFQRINNVFELQQNGKRKTRNVVVFLMGIFGVAFRSALLVGSFILTSSKIPFK